MSVFRRRFISFDFRALAGNAPKGSFEGYGSVFNVVDAYGTAVAPGAFAQTLSAWKQKNKLPKLLLQHGGGWMGGADDMVPVGKWDEMREDKTGLWGRGHLFDIETDRAHATYAALSEGELDGLSIGFVPQEHKDDKDTGVRTFTKLDLWEVSLVTFPANEPARVTDVRSLADLPTEREIEALLQREAGLSAEHAKAIIAKGYRHLRREVAGESSLSETLRAIEAVKDNLRRAS